MSLLSHSSLSVSIARLPHGNGLPIPGYATAGAAGMDLYAAVPVDEPVVMAAGERALIPTGIAVALPQGYEAQIRPRSGLALRHGIGMVNSPGTIDSDYRGEILVLLINHGAEAFAVERGARIAQMIVAPVSHVQWQVAESLSPSARGESGFGSTGVNG